MNAWMLSITGLLGRNFRSARSTPKGEAPRRPAGSSRRGRPVAAGSIRLEGLEGRALMTAAPSTPFAAMTGQISSAKEATSVSFPISAGELVAEQSATVVVGFAAVPASGSTLSPAITKATGPSGQIKAVKIAPHGQTAADRSARQTHLFAQVAPSATAAQTITVNVKALTKTTGDYIVEAYLAGDVNGDGAVDSNDLASMQAAYGSREGQANYNPADDINGDGRVGCIDRMLLTQNLGAHVVVPAGGSTTPTSIPTATPTPTGAGTTTGSTLTSTAVPLAPAPVPTDLAPQATVAPLTPVAATTTTVPVAVATPVATTTTVPARRRHAGVHHHDDRPGGRRDPGNRDHGDRAGRRRVPGDHDDRHAHRGCHAGGRPDRHRVGQHRRAGGRHPDGGDSRLLHPGVRQRGRGDIPRWGRPGRRRQPGRSPRTRPGLPGPPST